MSFLDATDFSVRDNFHAFIPQATDTTVGYDSTFGSLPFFAVDDGGGVYRWGYRKPSDGTFVPFATGFTGSPLTTKGDLWTWTTTNARQAVDANGTFLTADSAQTTGLAWSNTITKTTTQLTLAYDGGNSTAFVTSSSGDLTITPTGGDTTITGTLTATGALAGTSITGTGLIQTTLTTEQLRLRYNSGNYASFTVSSGGNLTIAPTGGTTTVTGALVGSSTITATTSFIGPVWAPSADSTSALKITKANGTTALVTFDTTNAILGIGIAPDTTNLITASITYTDLAAISRGVNIAATHNMTSGSAIGVRGSSFGAILNQGSVNNTSALAAISLAGVTQITGSAGVVTGAEAVTGALQVSGGGTLSAGHTFLAITAANTASTFTGHSAFTSDAQTTATNNTYIRLAATTVASGNWGVYSTTTNDNLIQGSLSLRNGTTAPTAYLHLGAGTTSASTAPLKFTSGTSMTSAEAGAFEFTTDDLFFTITTGTARKRLVMADAVGGLTSGRVAYVTTNGRLIDSAAFTFNGTRLTVPAGTGSGAARVGGTIFDHFADAGNSTTTETDLYSDTLAANIFGTNGDAVMATYAGTSAGSATATTQLKVYVAGTVCEDTGALSITTADSWQIDVLIIRVSSSVLRVTVNVTVGGVTLTTSPTYTEITGLTLSNTQIVKITGQRAGVGAATNDILAKLAKGRWLSAA